MERKALTDAFTVYDQLENSGSGPQSAIIAPAQVLSTNEDTPLVFDVFAGASTSVGTLQVVQFSVNGIAGNHGPAIEVSVPAVGTVVVYADGEGAFTPAANYNGTVPLISVLISNGSELKLTTVTITVNSVNDAPLVRSDSTITQPNTPVMLNVLANDTDADGDSLSFVTLAGVNNPVVGTPYNIVQSAQTVATVTLQADGRLEVDPATDYEGSFTFSYTVTDGSAQGTADVTVQVGFVDEPMFSPPAPIVAGDPLDEAAVNFALTAMKRYDEYGNGVNVTDATYTANQGNFSLNDQEPWLYDRATTFYRLYLRTRDPDHLAHALELAENYMSTVELSGGLSRWNRGTVDPTDVKYHYGLVAYWYEKETGNPVYRSRAQGFYLQSLQQHPVTYVNNAALWTERNRAAAIMNCLAYYWISGDTAALTSATQYVDGTIAMSTASGAPLHPHSQHEGSAISTPITSPWMSAFLVEAMLQWYRTTGEVRALTWMANYGDFVLANAFYTTNEWALVAGRQIPAYLVGQNIRYPAAGGPYDDSEHAFDIANMLMKCKWASLEIGRSASAYDSVINNLLGTAELIFNYWTRTTPGYPRYRVVPPRKYGWWFTNAYSKIYFIDVVPLRPINQTTPTISGSVYQGNTLTTTNGTWAGTSIVYTYQWRRDGANIAGATSQTYVTQEADIGTQVSCLVTATNAAGVVSVGTNALVIVAAGAPQITVQPTNQNSSVGSTATFSVTATGTPAPTYQWQKDSGSGFANISGATSSSYTTPTLVEADNADLFRCVVTNNAGSVTSNSATLTLQLARPAVRFGNNQGAAGSMTFGNIGATNFTVQALVYLEGALTSSDYLLQALFPAGRQAILGSNSVFEVYALSIGDSQTGNSGGALPTQPTTGKWYLMTVSGDSVTGTSGVLRGTMQGLDAGDPLVVQTRSKGLEASLTSVTGVNVNGGAVAGATPPNGVRYQWVRGYTGYRTASALESDRYNSNPAGAAFWWEFTSNGSGGVAVADLTGNGILPTITGGTIVTGPTI
jgi:hypothetical protein